MINNSIINQLNKYKTENLDDIRNSLKEVLQDIILSGFSKTDFFQNVVFYGGTSLRIFRNLPRFSEYLDFTLVNEVESFNLMDYKDTVVKELLAFGIKCDVSHKEKKVSTSVDSCYFRFNLKELLDVTFPQYQNQAIFNELISIKVEVEKSVIAGANTEIKLLTFPCFAQVKTFTMETLFASKLMAVLNRKWQTRIKGRDFYDYLFYVSNRTRINMVFLENGLKKFGYLREDESLTLEMLKTEIKNRFLSIDFELAKKDVLSFVHAGDVILNSFSKDVFLLSIDLLEEDN